VRSAADGCVPSPALAAGTATARPSAWAAYTAKLRATSAMQSGGSSIGVDFEKGALARLWAASAVR